MNLDAIHFIREILVQDHRGNAIPTMQTCEANAACLHPVFREAASYESAAVRTLYRELGGSRGQGERVGPTVVIPNRSAWASLWRIAPEQVQVIPYRGDTPLAVDERSSRRDKAQALNRHMRD